MDYRKNDSFPRLRSFRTSRAALWPGTPVTPPPLASAPPTLSPPPSPQNGAAPPRPRPPAPPAPPSDDDSFSFEKVLWPWLSRIGVALIFFGAVFFLRMAYDKISDPARVACGVGLGMVFLLTGELTQRRKDSPPALALVAGGLMLLYLSIYSGFGYFKPIVIPQTQAFLLLTLVTATGVALSLRHNSQLLMVLALAGGFLTPVMVRTGVDNQVALMTYIAVLDLAVIAIASWRRWHVMTWLCYAATVFLFIAWGAQFYEPEKFGLTWLFASIFFAIFAVSAILNNLVQKTKAGPERMLVVAGTAALYFGSIYVLMQGAHWERWNGLFALAVSAFFFAQSRAVLMRVPKDLVLRRFLTGLAVFFITLAIPLQLEFETVTVAWAAEALALTAYGVYTRDRWFQAGGAVVLALVFGHLFFEDQPRYGHLMGEGARLIKLIALGYGSAVAALGGMIALHQRKPGQIIEASAFVGAWVVELLLALFAMLLLNYYSFHTGYYPRFYSDARLGEILNISLILGLYSTAVITAGIARGQVWLRLLGLPILGFTLLKVVFYDLAGFDWTYRMISFMALGGLLVALSFMYARYKDQIEQWVGAPRRSN